jgi:hypothetical protein
MGTNSMISQDLLPGGGVIRRGHKSWLRKNKTGIALLCGCKTAALSKFERLLFISEASLKSPFEG